MQGGKGLQRSPSPSPAPKQKAFMESVVARVRRVDVAVVVERGGRPWAGLGRGRGGKTACLGHTSPFRAPGLDSVPREFWFSS